MIHNYIQCAQNSVVSKYLFTQQLISWHTLHSALSSVLHSEFEVRISSISICLPNGRLVAGINIKAQQNIAAFIYFGKQGALPVDRSVMEQKIVIKIIWPWSPMLLVKHCKQWPAAYTRITVEISKHSKLTPAYLPLNERGRVLPLNPHVSMPVVANTGLCLLSRHLRVYSSSPTALWHPDSEWDCNRGEG